MGRLFKPWHEELPPGISPEVIKFHRAMYDPHFVRQCWAWTNCPRSAENRMPLSDFVDDMAYCLDRTEATSW